MTGMPTAPVSAFLPAPREPLSLFGDLPPEGIHPALDNYIAAALALRTQIRSSVEALHNHRPGGEAWKTAMDRDAQAILDGATPKTWAVAALLDGEHQRWAEASAQCRTATHRNTTLGTQLANTPGIVDTVHEARAAVVEQRRPMLRQAWASARTGDLLEARLQLRSAEPHSKQISTLGRVHNWLRHHAEGSLTTYEGLQYPDTLGGRGDLGLFWAANTYIQDGLCINIPSAQDVDFPQGFNASAIRQPTGEQAAAIYARA